MAWLLNAPAAMCEATFASLGLRPEVLRMATQQGWLAPTPVQLEAIPAILQGANLWAEAPTGSGKTAAFALPLLQQLIFDSSLSQQRNGRRRRHVRTVLLTPTRELAVQTAECFVSLCRELPQGEAALYHPRVVAVHGGVSIQPQLRSLAAGTDVLVATPGRLLEVVESNGVSLEHASTLLLDEADRLLSPAFAEELEWLLAKCPPLERLQTMCFSATFPFPCRPKARRLLGREFASVGRTADRGSDRGGRADGGGDGGTRAPRASADERYASAAPPDTIAQRAIRVDVRERTPLLRHLLGAEAGWERVLVFVASQRSAEHVAAKLRKGGYSAESLHGGLTQEVRSRRLEALRAGALRVLVATDVAARGLDISGLEAIVNYELPRSTSDYTHRVGRTGRAGTAGVAVSFVASTGAGNEAHFELIERRHGGMRVPREVVVGFEPKDVELLFPRGPPAGEAGHAGGGAAAAAAAAAAGAEVHEVQLPGVQHSRLGLAHDRMHGGVKGRRMSKKDKLRAAAAAGRV